MPSTNQILDFDRRPATPLGTLPYFPITLGGKIVCIDVMVVQGPLYFNMLVRRDYVYAMKAVVSTLFRVMHFPHDGKIVTIDHVDVFVTSKCIHPYILCIVPRCLFREVVESCHAPKFLSRDSLM